MFKHKTKIQYIGFHVKLQGLKRNCNITKLIFLPKPMHKITHTFL